MINKEEFRVKQTLTPREIIDLIDNFTKCDYQIKFNKLIDMENVRIKDINVIVPNKVVEVTFKDNTKEKAVCQSPDVFSLESAIAICISKKIMGGSGNYNNAIKKGMKLYNEKIKKEEAEKDERRRIEKRREKRLAYKKRRDERKKLAEQARLETEREEKINIQKEAYIRAIRELGA